VQVARALKELEGYRVDAPKSAQVNTHSDMLEQ